jgi:ABC-type Na+ efflux pump permease subunit
MMGLNAVHIRAVVRKELQDYRRRRSIVVTMSVLPCIFLINPVLTIFLTSASTASSALDQTVRLSLVFFLIIPVIMPSTLAAYSVAGEREQGTLEPLLTTPIRRQEFILGKAAAIMIPTVALSYAVFGLFLAAVRLFANAVVASALFHQGPILLALLLFTPLLAGWAIVVGMAISVRASEIRVAQQLGMLATVPLIGLFVLLAVGTIRATFPVAILFAVALLVIDVRAARVVARMFDRERLVTGAKAARS